MTTDIANQVESLFSVVKKIGSKAPYGSLISIESTIPRGTSRKVFELVNHRLHVAHVPHRWYSSEQEAHGVNQLRIAGGVCDCCLRMAVEFYEGSSGGGSVEVDNIGKLNIFTDNSSLSIHGDSTISNNGSNIIGTNNGNTKNSAIPMAEYTVKSTEGSNPRSGHKVSSLGISLHLVRDIDIAGVTERAE